MRTSNKLNYILIFINMIAVITMVFLHAFGIVDADGTVGLFGIAMSLIGLLYGTDKTKQAIKYVSENKAKQTIDTVKISK